MKTQTSKSQIYCPMAAIRYARVLYEVGVPKEAVQKTREIFEEVHAASRDFRESYH